MYRFAVYFYQIRWFDITAFGFKAPEVQEVVEITASARPPTTPPPLNSFANIINYTYSKFESDPTRIMATMGQKVKQGADFGMHF